MKTIILNHPNIFSGQFHGEPQDTDSEIVIPNSNAFVDATGDMHPGMKVENEKAYFL